MPIFDKPTFLFVTCQVGAEPALKNEIKREHPELKFAYSRPGFVTFKFSPDKLDLESLSFDFELRSIFARSYGVSLARLSDKEGTLSDKAEVFLQSIYSKPEFQSGQLQPIHLQPIKTHIWERDRYAPQEEPLRYEQGKWVTSSIQALKSCQSSLLKHPLLFNEPAKINDLILDIILLEENEWWIGAHRHTQNHSPFPGGKPEISLPADAPSRAYIKLAEALLWSGAPIRKGDTAVEIGSSPGGASYLLLEKGLNVIGIDPAKMDPKVLASKNFEHIPKPVGTVLREDLSPSVQWLLLDMNVSPSISMYAVDRLGSRMRDTLLGLMLTIKLNQWKVAEEIPSILEHVKAMGMSIVRATQLPSNRQEIFIYALTRKGVTRRLN